MMLQIRLAVWRVKVRKEHETGREFQNDVADSLCEIKHYHFLTRKVSISELIAISRSPN